MKSRDYFTPQVENTKEDNYTNIKILLSLSLIIIFSYIIEKLLRYTFIKTFYLLIILIIIAAFLFLNLSPNSPHFKQLRQYLTNNFYSNPKKSKEKYKKEKLTKVKDIYESGYMLNKMNINYDEQNQMFNAKISNFNNNNYNIFNQPRNDDILANKISNINKINNEPLINSFNKNFTNRSNNESNINFESSNNEYNNINFLNNNNEFSGEKNYTNLPSNESRKSTSSKNQFNYNQINNNFEKKPEKEILSSPFNKKTHLPPSSSPSSGNFNLLSTKNLNKNSEPNFISNFKYTNPINQLSRNSDFEDNIYGKQIKIIPRNKETSYSKYQYLKSRYSNTQ